MFADWAQARAGRDVGVVRAGLARAREQVPGVAAAPALGGTVFVRYEPARRPVLLALSTPLLEAGGRPLVRDVEVALRRQDRVWLAGDQVTGKSTLGSALVAPAPCPRTSCCGWSECADTKKGVALPPTRPGLHNTRDFEAPPGRRLWPT